MSKIKTCENCGLTLCDDCNKKYQEQNFEEWVKDISENDVKESCSIEDDCENCGS
tara:strand:- start:3574 stop:3738 length:165 start_codon:yes stop_codon:yes gene_type:complete